MMAKMIVANFNDFAVDRNVFKYAKVRFQLRRFQMNLGMYQKRIIRGKNVV
jgi:hypothetical protein